MNDMVEAAVVITDEAVSLAEELLEKWRHAEELVIVSGDYKPGEVYTAEKDLKRKYEEYKKRLFKMRER